MAEKTFWERVEDDWKELYEDSVAQTVVRGANSFLESGAAQSFISGATAYMEGTAGSSAQQGRMPKAGSKRTTAGKSTSPGTFKAGSANLGYTPRVKAAASKLSQARTPELAATYKRLTAKRSRGPLIQVAPAQIKVG